MNVVNNSAFGSKLFTNAQLTFHLLKLLSCYYQGECTLSYLIRFVQAMQKQRRVKLYRELQIELEEFMRVEKYVDNEDAVMYCVNRLLHNITKGRVIKSG